MSAIETTSVMPWSRERAALLILLCLIAGVAGGWSIAGLQTEASQAPVAAPVPAAVAQQSVPGAPSQPGLTQLKQLADAQAAPIIEKLRSDPANSGLLTSLGNLYYDAQQYPIAVDYYARTLRVKPSDASVRTDMGTAFWLMGDADRAIAEFNKALACVPDNPNTLFNLGLVKWKGKRDAVGARIAWERLLATAPSDYQQISQTQHMLADVKTAEHQVQ